MAESPGICIHRPGSRVYLLTASNCLLGISTVGFSTVIYIMIASKMETKVSNQPNGSNETFRMALIVGGIIVAILMSPFLIQDANILTNFSFLPHFSSGTGQPLPQITSLTVEGLKAITTALVN